MSRDLQRDIFSHLATVVPSILNESMSANDAIAELSEFPIDLALYVTGTFLLEVSGVPEYTAATHQIATSLRSRGANPNRSFGGRSFARMTRHL